MGSMKPDELRARVRRLERAQLMELVALAVGFVVMLLLRGC